MMSVQEFQAFTNLSIPNWSAPRVFSRGVAPNIHGGPVFYNSTLYAWGEKDRLKGFPYSMNGIFNTQQILSAIIAAPPGTAMPGGALSASSNGSQPNTGVIWATVPEPYILCDQNGNPVAGSQGTPCDAVTADVPGRFYAFNATTLELLFEDKLHKLNKFAPPTVVNGDVYLTELCTPTDGTGCTAITSRLVIYGLKNNIPSGPVKPQYWRADVYGDGKTDLIARDPFGYISVYRSDGSDLKYSGGLSPEHETLAYSDEQGFNTGGARFFPVDIDSDGCTDLLVRFSSGDFAVWRSNCKAPTPTGPLLPHDLFTYLTAFNTAYSDSVSGYDNEFFLPDVPSAVGMLVRNQDGSFDVWTKNGAILVKTNTFSTRFSSANAWDSGNRFFLVEIGSGTPSGSPSLLVRNADGVFEVWDFNGTTFQYSRSFASIYSDSADSGGFYSGIRFFPIRIGGTGGLLVRWNDGHFDVLASDRASLPSLHQVGTFTTRFTNANGDDIALRFFPADIDGDGNTDLLYRNANGIFEVWKSNGTSFQYVSRFATRFTDQAGWYSGYRFF
jgi:hypothetical protein